MTRVGWIGLGAMGSPMAVCAARGGHDVTAYDVNPSRAEALAADGVAPAASIKLAATGVATLVVMVATADQVESVLFGDDSAAGALVPGSVVVVMATIGPAPVARWAERLARRGIDLVDSPVSGGAARAADGDLLIMAGGPDLAVDRVRPLLDTLARTAPHVGTAPGDGQKVKLVNQLLCGVHIAAAAEALALAEAMHLDPAATWDVVRTGAAASFMLEDRGERMVHGSAEVRSALGIILKDMGLVTDAARDSAHPAPLASAAEQIFLAGHRAGLTGHDDSEIIDILRGDHSGRMVP
ncbi:NAD(P)-dependent oxidoreductase [Amycolatopsis jiangsuensis]|uniref:3-hydroxyisobutyrate dehydrogenase/putative dehydrogenase n=1 Tax=Amycolatopsis jiangsuensis TaxID=1181879 RepID=A0A840IYL8_9PSEU|nr:NAD(P)-dependent oxidoreductase [Amycolatopsis jiangsuensis]MBB4686793.1 3-hydroxyisobutyrate dehydrogenase/putative dehydrogenase [Amycolatopsis jiangsuensis]